MIPCSCEDGRDGAQTYLDDGTYDECLCVGDDDDDDDVGANDDDGPGDDDDVPGDDDDSPADDDDAGDDDDSPGTSAGTPNWHWVLWDGDGAAVKAVVYSGPSCGLGELANDCTENLTHSGAAPSEFPCVHVTWIDGALVSGIYELATGKPDRCSSAPALDNMPPLVRDALDTPVWGCVVYLDQG